MGKLVAIVVLIVVSATAAEGQVTTVSPVQETTIREIYSIMNEREKAANQRFEAQEKAIAAALVALEKGNSAALTAAKEAVIKAEVAAEKRFDSVNEFRNTLKDQQSTLASKSAVDTQFKFVEEKISSLEARVNKAAGGLDVANWLWAAILGAAGLILGILKLFSDRNAAAAKGI